MGELLNACQLMDEIGLTIGKAASNMKTQVIAGFPVLSVINPATIPPRIPPTSKKVDK